MKGVLCLIAVIYFLNLNIDYGSALSCYYCEAKSGYSTNCELNVTNHTVATTGCYSGYDACMTLVLNNTIQRNCAIPNVCSYYRNETGFGHCMTCNSHLCNSQGYNSAFTTSYSSYLVISAVFVIVVQYFDRMIIECNS